MAEVEFNSGRQDTTAEDLKRLRDAGLGEGILVRHGLRVACVRAANELFRLRTRLDAASASQKRDERTIKRLHDELADSDSALEEAHEKLDTLTAKHGQLLKNHVAAVEALSACRTAIEKFIAKTVVTEPAEG